MKKVLFTLAALFAFGLTASAEQVDLGGIGPNIGIGTDANNLVTEVELAPRGEGRAELEHGYSFLPKLRSASSARSYAANFWR